MSKSSSAESEWDEFDRLHIVASHMQDEADEAAECCEEAWEALYRQRAKALAAGPRPSEVTS